MITRLTLRDFQAHTFLEVDFTAGVTTIVGPTDVGKSAILRALRWVLYNKPSGSDFIRWGAKKAIAEVEVDGHVIRRIRTKSENTYELDDKPLKAFGQDVPAPIVELLKVSDINVQRQFDRHFWFSDTTGEVSRKLNELVDLSVIDDVMSRVGSRLRTAQSTETVSSQRLKDAEAKLTELGYTVELDLDLLQLEQRTTDQQEYQNQTTRLRGLIADVSEVAQTARTTKSAVTEAERVVLAADVWRSATRKRSRLATLLESLRAAAAATKAELPTLTKVVVLRTKLTDLRSQKATLRQRLSDLNVAVLGVNRTEREYTQAHQEFHEQCHGHCPTCNHPTL